MNSLSAISSTAKLSEREQAALVRLLSDEDSAVYQAVREKIISGGPASVEWLAPHSLSDDAALRRHALDIIDHFKKKEADTRFHSFCLQHGEDFDLETGAFMLAQTTYPNINIEGYRALLDDFAAGAREKVVLEFSAEEKLTALNTHLFSDLGFSGNVARYYDPENSYLNRVLDQRTGNPINLTLLYLLVARRLKLPVIGIGMPGHFICRYQSSSDEIYIDPFNDGQLLSKADCIQYLQRGNYSLTDDFLSPTSARRMFLRICSNLHQIYTGLGKPEDTNRFQHYLVALAH